tara:strand:+ start:239 stop:685 length:447 start_codon:yes stop_codon:yes gene_type:complete
MNLGVYMETAQMSDDLQGALQAINEGLQARNLSDASIFYDTLGANTLPSKCGWFHSTDLWNFTGSLIATSINTALTASTVINKFKILLYYSRQDKDLMGLMKVAKDPSTKIICREQEDEKELARLTGRKSSGVVNNFNLEEILEVIKS